MGLQTYLPIEILDYVQTHEPSDEAVYGIGQRELAKALGYHPCSMSRPLEQLGGRGSARGQAWSCEGRPQETADLQADPYWVDPTKARDK